ncbi:MAG: hypothetical protein M1835_001798 [Candelina submexicana]|nr:MAG: hypothetical protein M1835_001798 [Candelina submexicana]
MASKEDFQAKLAILQTNLKNAEKVLGVESQSYKSLQQLIAAHTAAHKSVINEEERCAQQQLSFGSLVYRPKH